MVKVLLVDDDPDLRALLSVWLDGTDFELTLAADGYQGLQFARTDHPDVILLDIYMPVAKGFVVHERMKGMPALANVPVIYISSDKKVEMQAMMAGARFLLKPLEKDLLLTTLREAYDQAS
jgi:CheY-like chemotaxis protein